MQIPQRIPIQLPASFLVLFLSAMLIKGRLLAMAVAFCRSTFRALRYHAGQDGADLYIVHYFDDYCKINAVNVEMARALRPVIDKTFLGNELADHNPPQRLFTVGSGFLFAPSHPAPPELQSVTSFVSPRRRTTWTLAPACASDRLIRA